MKTRSQKQTVIVACAMIFVAAFSRLIEHLPNFSAMESIALFGGAYLTSRAAAFLIPIIAMYASDLVLNNTIMRPFFPNHDGLVLFDKYMIFNMIGMIAIVLIGRVLLRKVSAPKVMVGALMSSALFFVITNIGSWLTLPMYTKNFAGLVTSFTAAIPFFNNSWISTLLFSCLLFGAFELYKRYAAPKVELGVERV